jgi:hypothetical protein
MRKKILASLLPNSKTLLFDFDEIPYSYNQILHKTGQWSTRIEPILKAKISVHNDSSASSNKTAPYKKIIGICTKLYAAMSENYYKT